MQIANDVENQIRELDARRYQAMVTGDVDAFSALSHPDLAYTHSNGLVDTLSSYTAKCRDGYYRYLHIEHPVDNIQILGEVALVHGRMVGEVVADGVLKPLNNRALSIWALVDGAWKFLAYQPTPIK